MKAYRIIDIPDALTSILVTYSSYGGVISISNIFLTPDNKPIIQLYDNRIDNFTIEFIINDQRISSCVVLVAIAAEQKYKDINHGKFLPGYQHNRRILSMYNEILDLTRIQGYDYNYDRFYVVNINYCSVHCDNDIGDDFVFMNDESNIRYYSYKNGQLF